MSSSDVFSFGMVSSSTWYSVDGDFPRADGYAEIADVQYSVGGEAANSSIVLARLGARVKLDGNWIGDDDPGKRTKAFLDGCGIDTTRLPLREGYRGVSETVFASDGSRTTFGSYGHLQQLKDWNSPAATDIEQAGVVCLDPFFGDASCRAASIAKAAGKPVVTVDCRHDAPVLRDASVVVVSHNFLEENYPDAAADSLLQRYQQRCDGLVIFTFGERDIHYGRAGQPVQTAAVWPVTAVDTCCAGDAFRAGVVFACLREWDDSQTVRFAAALAAIVCTRYPGAMSSPSLAEVLTFMEG